MRPFFLGVRVGLIDGRVRLAALLGGMTAALCSCASPPAIGTNEPPDAVDRVRSLDLTPHALRPTPTADTGTGQAAPQVYYGSSAQAVETTMGSAPPGAGANNEGVNLNFVDAPVSEVAKVILGDTLGLGYAIDPRVQGTVTISSGRPIPKPQLLYVLDSALRMSNAVLVHDAGGYRIVPADEAVGSGHVDRAGEGRTAEPGYGISVVPLRHVSAQTILKLLDSFAAKPGSIRADPSRNLIIVAGNGVERSSAVETILSFDEDWMRGQSVGIFPIHNTTPEPVAAELEKILDSGEDGLSQHMVKLQPVAASNAILVVARKPELLRAAAKWIGRLDRSAVASTGVKVYKVRYGDCRQIARLLSELFTGGGGGAGAAETPAGQLAPGAGAAAITAGFTGGPGAAGLGGGAPGGGLGGGGGAPGGGLGGGGLGGGGPSGGGLGGGGALGGPSGGGAFGGPQSQGPFGALGGGAAGGTAAAPGGAAEAAETGAGGGPGGAGGGRALLSGVRILPDIPNNSVVIYANAENYRIIERALNQLDRPRAQVAIEVTLAEVTLSNQLQYGVQFFLGSLHTPFNTFAIDQSGKAVGQSTNQLGVQAINPIGFSPVSGAFNLFLGNKLTPHVIISALNQYTTTKILSNPSLVVVDNQVATLLVGDQVPITTGQANVLNTATVASNTVFNSITYQNTGIILRFQPHTHANGNINLDIDQEISAIATNSPLPSVCAGGTPCPSFTDRHVKSSVVVPDGQTVLLAGLIREEHDRGRAGVPVLDQIPIIGEAFTPSNTNNIARTELIIFIRPKIIQNGVDASVIAEELRSKMRGDKAGTLHPPGSITPYPLGLVQ